MDDAPLETVRGLVAALGFAFDMERDGERVVVVTKPHWGHDQAIEHVLREAGYVYESYAAGGMTRHTVTAPLSDGPPAEPRERYTVVVTRHPQWDDYWTMRLPGIPGAIWGGREPEGRESRDMATALINSWCGLMPDQVELVFEYR